MTGFAQCLVDTYFNVWKVRLWKITDREQLDKYGHAPDHPRYQFEVHENYIGDIPHERRFVAMALQYAELWNMTPVDVMDMDYAEFSEMTAVHKAITLKRPWWEGDFGDHVFLWEKTTGAPQPKPKRRT